MIPAQRTRNTRRPGNTRPGEANHNVRNLFDLADEMPRFDLYSRTDAICDRLLIEVPRRLADMFGLPFPTAFTAQSWADVVAWPDAAAMTPAPFPFECEAARLAEVLASIPVTEMTGQGAAAVFQVWRVDPAKPTSRPARVRLVVTVHPGDMGETVATISRPDNPAA